MTRTPDEIKKGLECCRNVWVGDHWKNRDGSCQYQEEQSYCKNALHHDALAYIQQLEDHLREVTKKVEQLEAENAELLEKVDRFSKVAFEQNMVILGKQDVITKQERVRANLQDEIWQLKQQIPRWISVEERLPENGEDVVVRIQSGDASWYAIECRINGKWGVSCITHWMPLPELPKEE